MSTKIIYAFLCFVLSNLMLKAQVVNIPDEIFLEYILLYTDVDKNQDGQIQASEAEAYTGTINVFNSQVKDLTGLEAFKNITALQVSRTAISKLDVSHNTKLQVIYASSTLIDKLDISNNTELIKVEAQYNSNLKTFVIGNSNYSQLQSLNISYNAIEAVDLSKFPFLISLNLTSNKLTEVDLTNNPRLGEVSLGSNLLTSVDVTKNTRLLTLGIGLNQISKIDLSNNKLLDIFNANGNPITELDLSNNTYLTQVLIESTKVTNVDISKLEMLRFYYVNFTPIKKIDASKNIALMGLQAIECPDLEYVNVKNGNNVNVSMCVTTDNPSLRCIEVDDPDYSNSAFLWEKDDTATYSSDCSSLSTNNPISNQDIVLYPNPVNDLLHFSKSVENVVIVNSLGQIVLETQKTKEVNLSKLSKGVYIVKFKENEENEHVYKKIIKK